MHMYYTDDNYYGFGSWLKSNAGAVGTGLGVLGAGLAVGLSGGMAAPLAGAIISGGSTLGGSIGGIVENNYNAGLQEENVASQEKTALINSLMNSRQVGNNPNYGSVFAKGGGIPTNPRNKDKAFRKDVTDPKKTRRGGGASGYLPTELNNIDEFTYYMNGGTHETNPNGGVELSKGNFVEQGEVRFNDPDTGESYIFSDRF